MPNDELNPNHPTPDHLIISTMSMYPTMSTKDFQRMSQFITRHYGIKMPEVKKKLLESRLGKRLRANQMENYSEYCDFLFSSKGMSSELPFMIDQVTTNKTDFFREPMHFTFMEEHLLPSWLVKPASSTLKIWSSACSSGEEPYTILIVLEEFMQKNKRFPYSVMGSDLSRGILQKAQNGVYALEKTDIIPMNLKRKYFLKSKDKIHPTVRVVPELRKRMSYRIVNLIKPESYDGLDMFDMVFCRNVLIYFDKVTQEQVINQICLQIKTGGYLFLGHSESVMGMRVPLQQIRPTIYRKIDHMEAFSSGKNSRGICE